MKGLRDCSGHANSFQDCRPIFLINYMRVHRYEKKNVYIYIYIMHRYMCIEMIVLPLGLRGHLLSPNTSVPSTAATEKCARLHSPWGLRQDT